MKYAEFAQTVTQLNSYIKDKIADDEYLNNVLVKGEISNFKNHYTGHLYFTLKDENSLIKCIMFKSYAQKLNFCPKDGMKVMVFGTVSVYERDGVYQIYVKAMEEDGLGDLYTQYQKLKEKLELEGLFDKAHKREIPKMPKVVGVLTSQTGAVIRDIINVSTRRNPNVCIKLFPIPVQGEGAAKKIVDGIEFMNKNNIADVLVLARGGGSLEDLWPFNEEIVARAIYASKIPVISAVGHETDFTISDFVSDLRAPTPSAAAELAVPDILEVKEKIINNQKRLKIALLKKVEVARLRLEKIMTNRVFKEPTRYINDNYLKIDTYVKRLEKSVNDKYNEKQIKYRELVSKLDALSPLKTLLRGYTIIEKKGKIVNSKNDVQAGDKIDLRFKDGISKAQIL